MIAPEYAVECLTLGFNRYIKQSKINATIKNSDSSISIYLENHPSGSSKSMQARESQHHPRLQNYVNGGEQPVLDGLFYASLRVLQLVQTLLSDLC